MTRLHKAQFHLSLLDVLLSTRTSYRRCEENTLVHIRPTTTQRAAEVFSGVPLGAIMATTLEEAVQ